ncbi:hypothetical protein DKX38_020701 [Salix brachista]|uniref:Uncharacterized protein n=1 Tax=Salix brachista TaxID=2182728 RepID=A0A5N5K8P6_9ROSI|nr:hypothetical protein DKX38_020701 [Salix brachista]
MGSSSGGEFGEWWLNRCLYPEWLSFPSANHYRAINWSEAIANGVEVNSINASGFTAKDALQSGGDCNDISILEMFQQSGAMKAMDITTNRSCFDLPS